MQFDISSEERELLERILTSALSDMRVEVRRTSTPRFHDELQEDEERLKQLVEKIQALAS